jgi:hypothetical protein
MKFEQKFARHILSRVRSRVARVARVATYLSCISVGLGLVGARVLYADVREGTVRLGKTLDRFSDLTPGADAILLNGATMHIATAFSQETPSAVLDRYEKECADHPGVLGQAIREIVATKEAAAAAAPGALKVGVVRDADEHGGMVVCFTGEPPSGPAPVSDRVHRFLATHDVSVFGNVRYVTVEALAEGRTRVRTIWTDGPVPIDAMFPKEGDAPGSDSPLAPRPRAARRIVAAAAEGEPYAVRIYRSAAPAAELRRFYDDEMAQRGFTRAAAEGTADGAAYVRDDGAMALVAIGEADGATTVSVVDGGRGGIATVTAEAR